MPNSESSAPVPMLQPAAQFTLHPKRLEALLQRCRAVLQSGRYILGAEVEAFEQEAADALGFAYAVGASSGTDALLLALSAVGIGPGDHVLCPNFTFIATASCIARLGARPRFVDVCPGCFNMLPSAAAEALTPQSRALLPVHLFGQAAAMQPLGALAADANLAVVEDCAQSFGLAPADLPQATPHRLQTHSFFPSKNLGGFGDAGLVATNSQMEAKRLRALRNHGSDTQYVHTALGGNFRLHALQAALLRLLLPELPAALQARHTRAQRYHDLFAQTGLCADAPCLCGGMANDASERSQAPIGLPRAVQGLGSGRLQAAHSYNQYVVRLRGRGLRDHVMRALEQANIGHAVYYPVTLHQQPVFAGLGYAPDAMPHSRQAAEEVLALPIAEHVTPTQQERISATMDTCVRAWLDQQAGHRAWPASRAAQRPAQPHTLPAQASGRGHTAATSVPTPTAH